MDNFRDSYFQVDWDLTTKRLKGTYWGKQYDTGRGFAVTVINGGQVVTPTNEVLRLKWEKPDNTTGYVNATIVDGKFIVENIDQMFTVHGSVRADFELSVAGEFVASITFYVSVEKAVAVGAIESSSDFTALQDALADVGDMQAQVDAVIANATVDSEVILARGTEATLGARLDSIEQDFNAQFPATNLVTNGDFSNGIEGWNIHASYGSITNVEGTGRIGSRYATYPAYQIKNTFTGHKYFFRLSAKSEEAYGPARCGLVSSDSMSTGQVVELIGLNNDMQDFSFIIEATADYDRICWMRRPNSPTVAYCTVDNVLVIDLTETFGEGKEPSVEEMGKLLQRFPHNWFDGTVSPFISQKELYEMFNKGGNSTFEDETGKRYKYWLSASNGNLKFNYEEV